MTGLVTKVLSLLHEIESFTLKQSHSQGKSVHFFSRVKAIIIMLTFQDTIRIKQVSLLVNYVNQEHSVSKYWFKFRC